MSTENTTSSSAQSARARWGRLHAKYSDVTAQIRTNQRRRVARFVERMALHDEAVLAECERWIESAYQMQRAGALYGPRLFFGIRRQLWNAVADRVTPGS